MRNVVLIIALLAACDAPAEQAVTSGIGTTALCDWNQVYGTADHAGRACPEQHGLTKVAELPSDVDWAAEVDSNGFLQKHEGAVVTFGDYVVVPTSSGFTDVFHEATTHYGISTYKWVPSVSAPGAQLVHQWDAASDFVTVDGAVCSFGCMTNGYVQAFMAAIGNGSVYAPAAHGRFLRLNLATGALQATIDPFAGSPVAGDARLTVDNAPMITPTGELYYTATAWPTDASPFGKQPRGSWLVKVLPTNDFVAADWSPDNVVKLGGSGIASSDVGIPRVTDLCEYPFGTSGQNPLTGPTSTPPHFGCGTQRPAMNAPVAFSAATNHLVAYSYANNARGVAFLIEINPTTLAPIRAADMRPNHLLYGCGVRLDVSTFPGCDVITAGGTTNLGVDPQFNGPIRLRTPADIMDNAPTVRQDGAFWTIGSYDGGFSFEVLFGFPLAFDARGAIIEFNSDGSFAGNNPEFGWEVTASWLPIFGTAGPGGPPTTFPVGFDVLQDRGLYSLGHLDLARYDEHFALKSFAEAPNQPFGDFVDTHIPFGVNGDHYGVTEFGLLYKIDANSQIVETVQLTDEPIEVLSGHIARDRAGRLYVTYAGRVHVIASSGTPPIITPPTAATIRRMDAARVTKQAAMRTPDPGPPTD